MIWEEHEGEEILTKEEYTIIDCKKCGFKHSIPIPSQEELDKYYKKVYYGKRKPDYCEQQKKDLDWWNSVYEERYQRIRKILNKDTFRVLDIGSGPGFFLKFLQDKGCSVLGFEPSVQASDYAKKIGVKVINENFDKNHIKELGIFDLVHTQGVIEHLRDPFELIKNIKDILEPKGIVFFCVANDFNPFQEILLKQKNINPWWAVPPEHINYFNVDSLKKFFENQDFEVVHVTTTFPIDLFLLMGDNYVENDIIGKECHMRRKLFEKAMRESDYDDIRKSLYEFLASKNLGRDIEIIAKRRES